MFEFEYVKPKSLRETLVLISEYQSKARLIAGDTDLIARMKRGLEKPSVLINIRELKDLDYINFDDNRGLRIGALTTLAGIEASHIIKKRFPILSETAGMMASPSIRAQATIGGNLCNAAPSADMAPALLVLEAKLRLSSLNGEKVVQVRDFFTGPGTTILKSGEVLSEIQIQEMPPQSGAVYLKQKRRKGADLAIVGVAAMVTLDNIKERTGSGNIILQDFSISDIRIALGAVAPTPFRVLEAESILKGKKLTEENLAKAARSAVGFSQPISDARSSAEYRLKLIEILVPRAIQQALKQAIRSYNNEK
jgi:CO/xanthine dehydrogenase FAD-binding subunit